MGKFYINGDILAQSKTLKIRKKIEKWMFFIKYKGQLHVVKNTDQYFQKYSCYG